MSGGIFLIHDNGIEAAALAGIFAADQPLIPGGLCHQKVKVAGYGIGIAHCLFCGSSHRQVEVVRNGT